MEYVNTMQRIWLRCQVSCSLQIFITLCADVTILTLGLELVWYSAENLFTLHCLVHIAPLERKRAHTLWRVKLGGAVNVLEVEVPLRRTMTG